MEIKEALMVYGNLTIKLHIIIFINYAYLFRLLASSKVEVVNEMTLKTGNTTIRVVLTEK